VPLKCTRGVPPQVHTGVPLKCTRGVPLKCTRGCHSSAHGGFHSPHTGGCFRGAYREPTYRGAPHNITGSSCFCWTETRHTPGFCSRNQGAWQSAAQAASAAGSGRQKERGKGEDHEDERAVLAPLPAQSYPDLSCTVAGTTSLAAYRLHTPEASAPATGTPRTQSSARTLHWVQGWVQDSAAYPPTMPRKSTPQILKYRWQRRAPSALPFRGTLPQRVPQEEAWVWEHGP